MAVVYFDSSALVKLLIDEDASELAAAIWNHCDVAMTSPLAFAEVRAALGAARRAGRLTARVHQGATRLWAELWASVRPVHLTEEVAQIAGDLAEIRALSGAGAVHLSSVLALGRDHVALAAWDQRLRAAAAAEGVLVLPA